jgi:transcriptional regulator with XRE-family HTH domain
LGIAAGIDEFSASPRINQYEKGTHAPAYDMVSRIGDVLDLPVAYFYADDAGMAEVIRKYHRKRKGQ